MWVLKKEAILSRIIDYSDLAHGYRVAKLAEKIANHMNLASEQVADITAAAIFHDIGKTMVDSNIIYKPGSLTRFEKEIVKRHVDYSVKLGKCMDLSETCLSFISSHHESFDGSGYPEGKKGAEIPLGGSILKACDVYDALASTRPYRKACLRENVFSIMEDEKHTFDPVIYTVLKEVTSFEN